MLVQVVHTYNELRKIMPEVMEIVYASRPSKEVSFKSRSEGVRQHEATPEVAYSSPYRP